MVIISVVGYVKTDDPVKMSSEVLVEIFFKQQAEKDKHLAKLNIISNDVAAIKSQVAC